MDLQKLNKIMIQMKMNNQSQAEIDGIRITITPTSFQGKINTSMFGIEK